MGYLFLGLAFVVIAKVYAGDAGDDEDVSSCLELFNPEAIDKMCCKSFESFEKHFDDATKECIKDDSKDLQCEDFECLLRKNGILKDNKIDEDKIREYLDQMEQEVPEEKAVINKLRSECLDGKYDGYPPEDSCSAIKFYVCTYINVYLECTSWNTDDTCSNLAESAKKCRSVLGI